MRQVKIWVNQSTADAFKAACAKSGVSMSSELSRFMAERSNTLELLCEKNLSRIGCRGGRRKETASIISRLEQILDAEECYCSNIPESLQSGPAYDAASQAVDALDQAIGLLTEAF
jgi:hypothetical protein